jgi:Sec-independent protein secretion pathway component TatC
MLKNSSPPKNDIIMLSKHWLHCLMNIFHYFIIIKFISNHIVLVWPAPLTQVLPHHQLIFWNLFEFSVAEITSKSISPTF